MHIYFLPLLYQPTMSYIPLAEKESRRSVLNFITYLQTNCGLNPSAYLPHVTDFMTQQHRARRMKLDPDTYLSVCEFLEPCQIVCLTTTCREFMTYYPLIWGTIQKMDYPASVIPAADYRHIRQAISLDHYYRDLRHMRNETWSSIHVYEKCSWRTK